jgi:hypothetical protein
MLNTALRRMGLVHMERESLLRLHPIRSLRSIVTSIINKETEMKKVIALIVGLLLLSCICFAAEYEEKKSVLLTRSVDTQKTYAFQVPWDVTYVGVFIPTIDSGTVGVEAYQHGANTTTIIGGLVGSSALLPSADTNWLPVLDLSNGQDAVVCDSGYDPGFVDLTPYVASLRGHYIRFTCATVQTTADTTWWIVFGTAVRKGR